MLVMLVLLIKKIIQSISNLKYFVVDCLREEPHPSHYNLDKILDLIKYLNPKILF